MDLIRALRILRHRWWVVAVIVVATVIVAVGTATYRNSQIEPLSRAEAPISFRADGSESTEPEGGLEGIVQAQIDEAQTRATEVNADLLEDPVNEVVADTTLGRLTFISRNTDPDEAVATASEMRRRFLTRQPVDMEGQIEEQLASLSDQMAEVRDQIAQLDAESQLPGEVASRRERLTTLLAQLEGQALQLEQELLVPSDSEEAASPEEVQEELDQVNSAIAEVTAELEAMPSAPAEFSPEMTERRALERQFRELEASYQELILQRSEVSAPAVELIDVFDETPDATPRRTAAAVALLFGGGSALAVLLITERIRRPVWFADDVPEVPFLATVPDRPPSPLPWYIHSGENRRKASIQALRSSLRARGRREPLVVGVSGMGVDGRAIQPLAADLALSFASTHASTAVIDASFVGGIEIPEFRGATISLTDIWSEPLNADQVQERVMNAVAETQSVHSNLTVIAAGETGEVPADVLAGPQVGHLFAALRELMDVLIVVSDSADAPETRAALDHTDLVLFLTSPGNATQAMFKGAATEMSVRHIDVAAVMLRMPSFPRLRAALRSLSGRLERRSTRGKRRLGSRYRFWGRSRREGAAASAPPRPYDRDKAPVAESLPVSEEVVERIDPVRESLGTRTEGNGRGTVHAANGRSSEDLETLTRVVSDPREMLEVLESGDPARLSDVAESFLVAWTTKIVAGRRDSGLDPAAVDQVAASGFVPLSRWKGYLSLGERFRHELRRSLGRKSALRLERLLFESVSSHTRGDVRSVGEWADVHYFAAHTASRHGEPDVWHITSPGHTVSVLIAAERLDSKRIEAFVDDAIIPAIRRLSRQSGRSGGAGGQTNKREEQMEDLRALGLALAWLMDGSHEHARLRYPSLPSEQQPQGWRPDWAQGMKLNIAPLQKLGILALPILSEDELEVLDPTV